MAESAACRIDLDGRGIPERDALVVTLCVSPPRSGHHLLTNYLFKYFSGDADFPDRGA